MTADLLIDGMLSGTGVRDAVDGGYVEPGAIGMSASLVRDLSAWHQRYEEAHFAGFPEEVMTSLDEEGLALASRAQSELAPKKIGYFSNGQMKQLS